jgi:spermidine synthase
MPGQVGVVGLGTGAAVAYGTPGERWTFFEIDPLIERIAWDPRYFTYLRDTRASVSIVQGDGRLSLARTPDRSFRLIILDAFSSDAIPVHLLTREAIALYFRKISPEGVLVFHLSNRYLALEPVLARAARELGVVGRVRGFAPDSSLHAQGVEPSVWAVVARDTSAFGGLNLDQRWRLLREKPGSGLWTDDFSNIFQVLSIRWPN